jgi:hypothetical protein
MEFPEIYNELRAFAMPMISPLKTKEFIPQPAIGKE